MIPIDRKGKLYLDFDNTIMNSIKAVVNLYNEDFKYYNYFSKVQWFDVDTYDFKECTCATKEQLLHYFDQPRFFEHLEFMDGAKEVIEELKDYYDIYIVTMGTAANLRAKEYWLKENIPYAKLIKVNSDKYKDKKYIDMLDGIFVDDVPEYLLTSNAGIKVCFGDYSWNEGWIGVKCRDWKELRDFLVNYKK